MSRYSPFPHFPGFEGLKVTYRSSLLDLPFLAGVAAQVTTWLDEEWTPLEVHATLGRATGDAFCRLRAGERGGGNGRDVSDVLLGLSAELAAFNFRETFTNPFEVSLLTEASTPSATGLASGRNQRSTGIAEQ